MAVKGFIQAEPGMAKDLSLSEVVSTEATPAVKLSLRAGVDGGTALSGPLASAQAVYMCFLTVRGSDPLYPDYGTNFLTQCRHGRIRTDFDVTSQFALATNLMFRFFRDNAVFSGLPANERPVNLSLENYNLDVSGSRLILVTRLHFAAGDAVDIVAPIKVI